MDVERTMEFILDQQAKFFAGMEGMRQRQDKFGEQLAGLGKQLSEFAEQQGQINMARAKPCSGRPGISIV